jgi:hypothetical protein
MVDPTSFTAATIAALAFQKFLRLVAMEIRREKAKG